MPRSPAAAGTARPAAGSGAAGNTGDRPSAREPVDRIEEIVCEGWPMAVRRSAAWPTGGRCSCPTRSRRDVRTLTDLGYRAAWVQPVDLFPETAHVEALTVLVPGGYQRVKNSSWMTTVWASSMAATTGMLARQRSS